MPKGLLPNAWEWRQFRNAIRLLAMGSLSSGGKAEHGTGADWPQRMFFSPIVLASCGQQLSLGVRRKEVVWSLLFIIEVL